MSPDDPDLEALLNRLVDGLATEADQQRLGDLLKASFQARSAYREFMSLHSSLYWDYVAAAASREPGEMGGPLARSPSGGSHPRPARSSLARRASVVIAGAIALTLLIAGAWLAFQPRGSKPEAAAVLHSAAGVQWGAESLSAGEELRAGQELNLAAGLAEIRFASGAAVMLQGPATLRIESARRATLVDGALSAVAPPQAVGFTVQAPGLKVVDLGTRFGLRARAGRGAELHVFQGRVQASLVHASGELSGAVTVNASEAVVVGPAAERLETAAAELDAFAFDASLQRDVGGLIAPAINGGSSWEGWTLQGASNQFGLYGSGAPTDVYKVYTTVFRFDDHKVSGNPAGSAGFAPGRSSAGAFANGHTILGLGVERVSGSPIAVPTVMFDLGNDSYRAATTVGGADGRTDISHAHGGDFNTQFHYGDRWTPETLAVFDGQGDVAQLTGNLVGYDFAFRAFAVLDSELHQTKAYQLFFDLDAMTALYGPGRPGVGIGAFGGELTLVINGQGSNHAVISHLPLVSKPSGRGRAAP